jgi:PAS domain S-box-containing protein
MFREKGNHEPGAGGTTAMAVRESDLEFRRLLDKIPGGAYTCDADGLITYFNQHAAVLWGRSPKLRDPVDRFCGSSKLYAGDGSPIDHNRCWMALALQTGKAYNGQEIVIERPPGDRITVLANANPIHDESGRVKGAVNVLVDITALKSAETAIRKLNESLEQQVVDRTATLRIIQDVAMEANKARTVQQAMRGAVQRICECNGWPLGHAFSLAKDKSGQFVSTGVWYSSDSAKPPSELLVDFRRVTASMHVSAGDGMIGRVVALDQPMCVDDLMRCDDPRRFVAEKLGLRAALAFPVRACGEVAAVLEFFSSEPIERNDQFWDILPNLGIELGHVIERERLERAIADATTEQQCELGREMHDSVSQILTGVGMMAETLRHLLGRESSPHSELATKLVRYLNEANQKVRQVSRGLMPVDSDPQGLMKALERLAQHCRDVYDVHCRFQCDHPVPVTDHGTQLYYIAREAAHNAAKHAHAGAILIRLDEDQRAIRLIIEDDGTGMHCNGRTHSGMGLSIMRHRARVIGADLDVHSNQSGGTTVTCTLPR